MQNLFSNDRMIVKGRLFEASVMNTDNSFIKKPMFDILFIFQVNGKLTQSTMNMELCSATEFWTGEWLTLRNWNEWYNVESLFTSMWYRFTADTLESYNAFYNPMKEWIAQLENQPRVSSMIVE